MGQVPAAGEMVTRDDPVTLTISGGITVVPSLTGCTLQEAEEMLITQNLAIHSTLKYEMTEDAAQHGRVAATAPEAENRVAEDTPVQLTIYRYPEAECTATLRVTLPDGRQSGWEHIRVNHPLRFGPYKIYQQTYGAVAAVTVTNRQTGGSDVFCLPDPSFISLDNHSGLLFMALYPDYTYNTDGEIVLLPAAADGVGHPVYCVQLMESESAELRFFFPGDTAEAGGLSFRFEEPQLYPGLRIKYTPALVNALLIVCFALMIAGLYLLFFLPPVLVKVDDKGYAVGGPKPEGMRLELERLLKSFQREESL
jgi:hypothetical protein